MSQQGDSARSVWLTDVPEWFLAVAAFVYATGFLVVFTYFESFGVRELGGDFFRVKYVHVGILCLLFMGIVAVPCYTYALLYSRRHHHPPANQMWLGEQISPSAEDVPYHLASAILVINMLVSFYIFAMFAPSGYVLERDYLVPPIFLMPLLGLALISLLGKETLRVKVERAAKNVTIPINAQMVGEVLRWLLLIVVVAGVDRYCFREMSPQLREMFFGPKEKATGGYLVFIFVFIILFVVWRTQSRMRKVPDKKTRLTLWTLSGCLIVASYYLAVLAFAFRVYPYIPSEKGGGGFVQVPAAIVRFKGDVNGEIPPEVLDCSSGKCERSKPLIIIEETDSALFVADPNDSGGPVAWRRGSRPRVFSVSRASVISVAYNNGR